MGIEPNDTNFIVTFAVKGGESRNAADGDGMIPAEDDRNRALFESSFNVIGELLTSYGNLGQIFQLAMICIISGLRTTILPSSVTS